MTTSMLPGSSRPTLPPPDVTIDDDCPTEPIYRASIHQQPSAAGLTHAGLVRERNEDAILVDAAAGLFVVADGLGGHSAGDVASTLACDTIARVVRADRRPTRVRSLTTGIRLANRSIRAIGVRDPRRRGLGTTVVSLLVDGGSVTVAHVGDSRCYRMRNRRMVRLTRDHTPLEEFGAERIKLLEFRPNLTHMLLQAVGTKRTVIPELYRERYEPDDLYLLCSDGLTRVVHDDLIAQVLASNPDPEYACRRLIELSLHYGGPDNVSVVVVRTSY